MVEESEATHLLLQANDYRNGRKNLNSIAYTQFKVLITDATLAQLRKESIHWNPVEELV